MRDLVVRHQVKIDLRHSHSSFFTDKAISFRDVENNDLSSTLKAFIWKNI